ncbi:MAG: ATP synthase F1 subunit delta [Acidobacteria bacterium]|nr:ATP synthase F1 subunit delta [Acidobacteriota bacterium]
MTNRAAAIRYARALFDVTVKDDDLQKVEGDLAAFAGLFGQHPPVAKALLSPAVPAGRKRAVVAELLRALGALSPAVSKLVLMLADRDRLALVPDVLDAYRVRLMDHQRIVRAEITTAVPIPADKLQTLERSLAETTGKKVSTAVRVDPAIIGGVVAKIGSTVYDGSVARQLERMRERLTNEHQG